MPTQSTCQFQSPRGHALSARLERPDGPIKGAAVFAHCFTCSKDLKAARRISTALAGEGYAVLSFDFTGLGASDGDFSDVTFSGDVDDLVAAATYLTESVRAPQLLVGHSLGGAAVLAAASRIPSIKAVATIGAPADAAHVKNLFSDSLDDIRSHGSAHVEIAGRTFTIRSSFVDDICEHRLVDGLGSLDAALLFLHAPGDRIVGIANARRLFEAAKHPKSFVSLDDADHLLTRETDASYASQVIASWAARYVSSSDNPETKTTGTGDYEDATTIAINRAGLVADVKTRGFDLRVDEPRSAGGTETGPTPYDYLAASLASCTSLTLRMYAERKGMRLDEVSTAVTFDRVHADDCRECEHETGRIERFDRTVTLAGDLTEDDRSRLLTIANRCPVHNTLEGQIEVHTTLAV